MNLCVTEGTGEIGVHLHDGKRPLVDQVPLINRADGQGHIAVLIHGGYSGQHHGTAVLISDAVKGFTQNGGRALGHVAHQFFGLCVAQTGIEKPAVMRHNSPHFRVLERLIIL
ncbi:hypothetical protein SDC9_126257 [bioreactor metagenome]|uniref:Uncharacterized protein n=1 Tax=bioreactor metagenome TaxID=1076179 RepID=A0A645CQR3_9ZZZZ